MDPLPTPGKKQSLTLASAVFLAVSAALVAASVAASVTLSGTFFNFSTKIAYVARETRGCKHRKTDNMRKK